MMGCSGSAKYKIKTGRLLERIISIVLSYVHKSYGYLYVLSQYGS